MNTTGTCVLTVLAAAILLLPSSSWSLVRSLEHDPVMTGLVTRISRPGGNITGMFLDLAELSGKQLQLLKELVPKLSRVAVLGDLTVNASQLSALDVVGRSLAV